MLALMGVAAEAGPATLVFDEVDAGIGGQTARAVGEQLRELAAGRQVICITHLPQIASLADRHFTIVKDTSGETARTTVTELRKADVVGEIVRMLGADREDAAARRHAKELLKAADDSVPAARRSILTEASIRRASPMPESRPRTRYIFITGGVVSSLGKGIAAASIGRSARLARPEGRAAEVRSVHQHRSGDDVAVPARRGLRHRGRRRDRPRSRPLRALHGREHVARLERHRRRGLQLGHPQGAPRRLPRRHRAGRPAHHGRDQAPDPADRRDAGRRRRDHRDRRHGGRHRVAAVPGGDPPVPGGRRPPQRDVHPPHARALHRPRG